MSGVTPLVDTLLATRLAQRVDLVPLKGELEIAGPGAVTLVEGVSNDVRLPSRAALQQQLGVGLSYRGDGGHTLPAAPPGGAVTLSAAARAVSVILDLPSGAMPKIRGAEPLWPHPHQQPPLAHLLAATLTRTVASSGLFYESHLQQYAAGTRTLAQLVQEPQARLETTGKMPPALPAARVAGQDMAPAGMARITRAPGMPLAAEPAPLLAAAEAAPPDAAVVPFDADADAGPEPLVLVRPGTAAPAGPPSRSADYATPPSLPSPVGLAVRLDPTPLDPAHLAASYGSAGVRDKAHGAFHDIAGQEPGAESSGAGPLDAVATHDPVAAAIHPDAVALVRQQLELLAVPVFRWAGEAWPGTPMDWEIHEEREERQATEDPGATQPTWNTRLAMTLPRLGAVEVRLSLAGSTLQVHLAAGEDTTVALLNQGGIELPQRFDALGLQLTGLQIGALAQEPAAPDTGKDDHAA